MPAFRIALCGQDDAAALALLFHRAVHLTAIRAYSPAQCRAWAPDPTCLDPWTARLASRPIWGAFAFDRLAGFTDLETDGHIDVLFVDPDFLGQGAARQLLDQSEQQARALGLPRLFVEASIPARPVFERRGFQVLTAQTVTLRGQDFLNYRMEKRLADS